ncbi:MULTISPECIES: archaetidylserine decarboxylase [Francisella]|uniref:Phosphatidylserine decarboxylase proenzyme n=1 Tax=Francisella opportunistica TaxID=2016517 RepID=A0A345JSI1_9GAMM|nr:MULTISPECIES: archaetidylserine decarboxylase [Francisella]APC92047.1 Phosphatidylserine decarboxylase [Francisella sp. MA067296]AXH30277.1 phosphatidylserine decarboxylase [Francisella opportunistica]AXH31918.1 phosphatidylserine decarboxylase [Francisella opportunistica]AXH33564.1 phosphatidylserine decarboxylase [Francisella opportunistica]
MKDNLFIYLQYLLPHAMTSRLISKLADSKNKIIKNYLINLAIKKFNINLAEAKETDISKYPSFNDFFIRELKDDLRPLSSDKNIISSPADGILSQFGTIKNNSLIQAKDRLFSLKSLIAASSTADFTKFATIYLSPKDYHRVHMPIDGMLTKMVYVPGKLFSVNKTTTSRIDNLFAKNERLICYFDTVIGEVAVIFVGALLVAGIETVWHGKVAPNYYKGIQTWDYSCDKFNVRFNKGDTLGWFNFGSTVIVLTSGKNVNFKFDENQTNIKIQVNQDLALIAE